MEPTLIECPIPILTKRLQIRPVSLGDGLIMFDAIKGSFPLFIEWFDWTQYVTDSNIVEKTAREFHAKFILRKEFNFLGFDNNKLVGSVGIHNINWRRKTAEVGYWVRVSEQRKGYCREIVEAISAYTFKILGIQKLLILVDDENIASIKTAEASGFKLETKALGISSKPGYENLRMGRSYVMFSTDFVCNPDIKW